MEGTGSARRDFIDNPTDKYVGQARDQAIRGAQSPSTNQSARAQSITPVLAQSPINLSQSEISTCIIGEDGVNNLSGTPYLPDLQRHMAGSSIPLQGNFAAVLVSRLFTAEERSVVTSIAMDLRNGHRSNMVYRLNYQADPSVLFFKSISYQLIQMGIGQNQQPRPPLLCKYAYTQGHRLLIDKVNILPMPAQISHATLTSRHGIIFQARSQDNSAIQVNSIAARRLQKVEEAFAFIRQNILSILSPGTRRLTIRYVNIANSHNQQMEAEYSSSDHSITMYNVPPDNSSVRYNEMCANNSHFTVIHELGHALPVFFPNIIGQFNTAAGPNPLTEYSRANTGNGTYLQGYNTNTHEALSEAFALWVLNSSLVATLRPAIANLFVQRFGAP